MQSFTSWFLLVSPIAVVGFLVSSSDVLAADGVASSSRMLLAQEQHHAHPVPVSMNFTSDPQVPRGCACSRCSQSTQILQGQFPVF